VRLSPFSTSATIEPNVPVPDDDERGEVGGMIDRVNRNTRRKPAPMLSCPPQIPHDLTWARTRAAVVGSLRLTAWATARPSARTRCYLSTHVLFGRFAWHENSDKHTDTTLLTAPSVTNHTALMWRWYISTLTFWTLSMSCRLKKSEYLTLPPSSSKKTYSVEIQTSWVGFAWGRRQESCLRNAVLS
jgi:hypothetical protein